jgi:large repetitive protein
MALRYVTKIFSLILVVKATLAFSQVPNNQDCLNAIPICNSSYTNLNIITGTGNIGNEINALNSCLLTGERNDIWYIVNISTSGNLSFTINPVNPLHNYDWAVYDLTNSGCTSIFTDPSLEIACNYNNSPGNTGPNGQPGAQNGPVLPVAAGQILLINVSAFSTLQQSGYTIDFSASTASVTDNNAPQISSINASNCGTSNLTVNFSEWVLCNSVQLSDFTITGPGGPYTLNTLNSSICTQGATASKSFNIGFTPSIITPGTYFLNLVSPVTDQCGNSSSGTSSLPFQISGINISFTVTDVTCFGGNNGSASANVTGPAGPYIYQWSNGSSSQTASWLTAGTYTVTVTSPGGCSGQGSVTVNQPSTALTASATVTAATGCAPDGSATVTVSNGQAPITYNWWPSGGNSATANNLTAGGYMVTITDANQCVLNYFLTVPSSGGPTASISNFNNVSCNGGNDGSATVSVSGVPGPFTYQWSPSGGAAATASNLTAGNYSVVVTISASCTVTASVVITEPPTPLNVFYTSSNTTCGISNGSININVNGSVPPYNYTWSPSVSSGPNASGLPSGTYTVTVTDANGCTEANNIVIAPSSQPSLSTTALNNVTCFGLNNGSVNVTVNGGQNPMTYLWSNGQTSANIQNLSAGTYTVTVTDFNGCTDNHTIQILQPSELILSTVSSQNVNCFGESTGSATMNATGGTSPFSWQWAGSTSISAIASNLSAGTYFVTVTDQNGCSNVGTVSITQPQAALSVQGTVIHTSCGNDDGSISALIIGGTSPYSYSWNTGATTQSLINLSAGTYSLSVTDNNGCTKIETFDIVASDGPQLSVNTVSNVSCAGGNDGNISVNVNGGSAPYQWSWSGSVSVTSIASGLTAGTYTVTVSDISGCTNVLNVNISQPDPLAVTMSAPVNICQGGTATFTASVTGGTPPYLFSWSSGATVSSITVSPVTSAIYTLTITDRNGCSASSPVIVNVAPPLGLVASFPDSVCTGSDITINLNATGGDGNYTYLWNGLPGNQNQLVTVVSDTSLNVIINDGCGSPPVSAVISIVAVGAPVVNFTIPEQKGCMPLLATFSIPGGPVMNYTYTWTTHWYKNAGKYTVTVTVSDPSANSCETVIAFPDIVEVFSLPEPDFVFEPEKPTLFHPEVQFFDKSKEAINWEWHFGDGKPYSFLQSPLHIYGDTGTYRVKLIIESPNGCRDSAIKFVEVRDDLQIYIPNAFTPNENGTNDEFTVQGVGYASYEISIFNRWGNMVHHSRNGEKPWDGKDMNSGKELPQGLYIYRVTITDHLGNISEKFSHVTLIR